MFEQTQIRAALTLLGLAGVSSAAAQEVDAHTIANQQVQTASCADVTWQAELLAQYPRIAEACQEVVISDGTKWARFTGEFMRRNADGSIRTTIDDRAGKSMGQITLLPGPDQRVLIGERRYRFSELEHGQQLSLYVPESRFAVASEPGAPAEQMAQIVPEPAPVAEPQPVRLAQVEPRQTAASFPHTAGPLPLLALGGLLSLAGGLGLTLKRRFPRGTAPPSTG